MKLILGVLGNSTWLRSYPLNLNHYTGAGKWKFDQTLVITLLKFINYEKFMD